MHTTTTTMLTRLTFSAGLGLMVIAGGAIAASAAPPEAGDELGTHPPYEIEVDHDVLVGPGSDFEHFYPYPSVEVTDFMEPGPGEATRVIPGGIERPEPLFGHDLPEPRIPLPEGAITPLPHVDDDAEVGSGPTVDPGDIDDCNPVAACPPVDIPGETPVDIPEETPETDPVTPTKEGSLPFTGAGSLVLATAGVGITGAGVVACRLSRRTRR